MWREKEKTIKLFFTNSKCWWHGGGHIFIYKTISFFVKKNILKFFWISGRVFLLFVIKKINKKTLIPSAGKNTISINKKNITFCKKYFPQLQIDAGEASTFV